MKKIIMRSVSLFVVTMMFIGFAPSGVLAEEVLRSEQEQTSEAADQLHKKDGLNSSLPGTVVENADQSDNGFKQESDLDESIVVENQAEDVVNSLSESESELTTAAEKEYTSGNYKYVILGGGLKITKYIGSEGSVVIPDTISDYQVTAIGDRAFQGQKSIGKIAMGNYVESIGSYAFENCQALGTITLNSGLKSIGRGAFISCSALSCVTIPDSVNTLFDDGYSYSRDGVFANCTALKTAVIGSGVTVIPDDLFYKCESLNNVSLRGEVTKIGDYAFNSCKSLSVINLPDSISTIGSAAFAYCQKITDLAMPSQMTALGEFAFTDCLSLASVTLNEGLKTIEAGAFRNCKALNNIVIPDSVSKLVGDERSYAQDGIFAECNSLKTAVIGNGVIEIPEDMFYSCDNLSRVDIKGNVTNIRSFAFKDCVNLQEVDLPESLQTIDDYAFKNCKSLKQVSIPDQVVYVAEEAYRNCTALDSVRIGNSVTTIYMGAFQDCSLLSNLSFGNGLTNIQNGAFQNCDSLTEVTLPTSLTSLLGEDSWNHSGAFSNCDKLKKVVIPENVTRIDEAVFKKSPVTIYGIKGSYAQEYANKMGILFEEIGAIVNKLNIASFSADKASGQKVGTLINLATTAEGGTTPYQYQFYYQLNGNAVVLQNYSSNNKAFFTPSQVGSYKLFVDVKDASGTSVSRSIDNYVISETPETPDTPETPVETGIICNYRTHVQNEGWQVWKSNGVISGTSGKGLRLEGIEIALANQGANLGIEYNTHIQNVGWQGNKKNGVMSGTSGKGLRLEAIKINLTGSDKDKYDIYYSVHAENFGWLDWAKNGAESGTAGYGYRLEAIKIVIVPKGAAAPGKIGQPFLQK